MSKRHLFASGLMALALVPSGVHASAESPVASRVVVQTRDGPVRGVARDGIATFLGIPYAAPPVGALRWRPPAAPARHGLLDTVHFANSCAQSNELAVFTGPSSVSEDCLYVNVYTSGVKPDRGKLRPVIVWFHGGGNFTGSANDYDGSALARGGPDGTPAVVVTLNYRLGLLGFLAHPALDQPGEPAINYGTLDQQAALRWVKENIAAFGGDPAHVAISGQSGGSVDVHANVVSPLGAGLFSGAIFQSAPAASFAPLAEATKRGEAFAQAAGCADPHTAAACLRALSVPRILQLQGTVKDNGPFLGPGNQNVVLDGTVIPHQALDAYASGRFNHVAVMGGVTSDELSFVIGFQQYLSGPPAGSVVTYASDPPARPMDARDLRTRVAAVFGPAADKVSAAYPTAHYDNDAPATYSRMLADRTACEANLGPLKMLARTVPTYGYVFAYQDAPFYLPKMPGFRARAAHTIDIQFLFRGYHGGSLGVNLDQVTGMPRDLNERELRLSDQLIGFWTNFAATGNPNRTGDAPWPALKLDRPQLLVQDTPLATLDEAAFRARFNCAFWEGLRAPK